MAEYQHQQELKREQARHYVVTVSRGYGSMGKEVAQALADTLKVRCCDRYILQQVAKLAHVDEEFVAVLDEHVSKVGGHWWQHLLDKEKLSLEDYFQYLVKVVLSISQAGGVIVGRGAHMILGPELCYRVRIAGSHEQCAQRIAQREGINIEAARQRVTEVDQERSEYICSIYGADIADTDQYDLVLNSDDCTTEQLVDKILLGMQTSGYVLPEDLHLAP
jgi:cytidylate kinase